jgi:hypothetical protein
MFHKLNDGSVEVEKDCAVRKIVNSWKHDSRLPNSNCAVSI